MPDIMYIFIAFNPGNNMLAIFNNLTKVRIAISKTILDI